MIHPIVKKVMSLMVQLTKKSARETQVKLHAFKPTLNTDNTYCSQTTTSCNPSKVVGLPPMHSSPKKA